MDQIADANLALAVGALLVLFGVLSSLLASRFGTPLLLVFLVVGMLAGEDGPGGIRFDDFKVTYTIGSFALAVILFDGGLRTRLSSVRDAILPATVLATLGVAVTAAIVGVFARFVFGLGWAQGLLLGAVVASTDAAAVFFLLKTGGLQLRPRVGAVLEIESGANDPVAVFLTLILTHVALAGGSPGWEVTEELFRQAVLGAVFGLAAGFLTVFVLNRLTLLAGLHPLFVVASAITLFGVTALLDGSGFLAVYVAGLVVGNRPVRAFPTIVNFHDTATWLCQIAMFLVLGLLVTPSELIDYAPAGIALAVFLILFARPAAVWLSLRGFGFSRRELVFVSWVGLRGAVSIFLATIPTLVGIPGAELYFNVAFFVVIISLVVQGWTIAPAARRLGMALKRPSPPTARVEIDLPGQREKELVGYPVVAGSFVALRPGSLPAWMKTVLVVRGGDVKNAVEAGDLRIGDYAYVLVSPERIRRLDRLFAPLPPDAVTAATRQVFGEFPIAGDAPLSEVVAFYGLAAPEGIDGQSVADAFALRYGARVRPGSRIDLGSFAAVVVRTVEAGRVSRAGLRLEEVADLSLPPERPTRVGRWLDRLMEKSDAVA